MSQRAVGVEEELMLVEPGTGRLLAVSDATVAAHRQRVGPTAASDGFGAEAGIEQELFLQQIETGTTPCRTADELAADLVACRRAAAASAEQAGAALVAVGTPVLPVEHEPVTPKPRYRRIVDEFGEIGRQGSVCGMHVHVDVADDNEGVRVIDGLRPWLPVLRALSVNSPFFHGRDTGYASWRTQVWGRWPTAGPSEPFGDPAGYRSVVESLIASGAALDHGMLYLDARLSRTYPTVELRIFDSMTAVDDVVLLALLSRALVSALAQTQPGGGTGIGWRPELLRAAHWRASRYGMSSALMNPVTAQLEPARAVVESMMDFVREPLEETADTEEVASRFEQLMARGTGASRQRAAFERGGLPEVMADLQDRFGASLVEASSDAVRAGC